MEKTARLPLLRDAASPVQTLVRAVWKRHEQPQELDEHCVAPAIVDPADNGFCLPAPAQSIANPSFEGASLHRVEFTVNSSYGTASYFADDIRIVCE